THPCAARARGGRQLHGAVRAAPVAGPARAVPRAARRGDAPGAGRLDGRDRRSGVVGRADLARVEIPGRMGEGMTPDQAFSIVNLVALAAWVPLAALPRARWPAHVAGWLVPALLSAVYVVLVVLH